jgi:hypothetical protein
MGKWQFRTQNQPVRAVRGSGRLKLFRENKFGKFCGAVKMLRVGGDPVEQQEDESGSGNAVTNSWTFS